MSVKQQFDSLHDNLVEAGGIATIDMRDLRDRMGAGKLGKYVIVNIGDELKSRGIGHSQLSNEQTDRVRVYKLGTPIANVIEAATGVGEHLDERLRQVTQSNAEEVLKQIRALVCPD